MAKINLCFKITLPRHPEGTVIQPTKSDFTFKRYSAVVATPVWTLYVVN